MTTDIRSAAMANFVAAIAAVPEVAGVIDDVPWDYAAPPKPASGNGTNRHPFVYAFEDREAPEPNGFLYECLLPVTVEATFLYTQSNGIRLLKPTGRLLLAALQAGIMADPNRGGTAENTAEVMNAIEETAIDGIGVVIWKGIIRYVRNRQNPTTREAIAIAA